MHLGRRCDTPRVLGAVSTLVPVAGAAVAVVVARSAAEAREWAQLLRTTLRRLGVSDVNMEEGSLRVDGNVSVRREGEEEREDEVEEPHLSRNSPGARAPRLASPPGTA